MIETGATGFRSQVEQIFFCNARHSLYIPIFRSTGRITELKQRKLWAVCPEAFGKPIRFLPIHWAA